MIDAAKVLKKLAVPADPATSDASCSSSGKAKRNSVGGQGKGSTESAGICHSDAPDGRCILLLSRKVAVLSERGQWFTRVDGVRVRVTLHPAALLRTEPAHQNQAFADQLRDLRCASSDVRHDQSAHPETEN